jgi:Domain of unknown function (DUF6265)
MRRVSPRAAIAGAVLAIISFAVPAAAQQAQPRRPLAALAFMAGCWRGDAGVDKTIEEQWTAADSDVMLATTRYLDDNTARTRGWEFSRIVADAAGITLFPAPMGEQRGRFRLRSSSAREARFEDPAHDNPKRIIYRHVNARRMDVQLDAGEGDREMRVLELERVACPGTSQR